MREIHGKVMPHFGKQVVVPLPNDSMLHLCQVPGSTTPASRCTRKVLTMERLDDNLVREHTAKLLELFAEHRGMDLAELKTLLRKPPAEIDKNNPELLRQLLCMKPVSEASVESMFAAVKVRDMASRWVWKCSCCAGPLPPSKGEMKRGTFAECPSYQLRFSSRCMGTRSSTTACSFQSLTQAMCSIGGPFFLWPPEHFSFICGRYQDRVEIDVFIHHTLAIRTATYVPGVRNFRVHNS